MGGDVILLQSRNAPQTFQSTPPYGGRPDFITGYAHAWMFQSTPPYGGRRAVAVGIADGIEVSIHAPVWGATICAHISCDCIIVSIHAPVWGATTWVWVDDPVPPGFNPRPRMGGDLSSLLPNMWRTRFQSTPPYGATQQSSVCSCRILFQSTPPYGATVTIVDARPC